ncbi:hypothetical protein [Yersinia kristensenii]|uniref:hypothetical protein n=1 Tax=Yersinia kristensenii TaxID=28152 RepID=UPI0012D42774|nr:hypothetical protein [Yersinia kristensenii]QKJ13727.1 hypothetical protein HRD70_00075 [Yersinia kristensenii]
MSGILCNNLNLSLTLCNTKWRLHLGFKNKSVLGMGQKKAPQKLRCCIKSLWTDRVNVQEVKKNSSLATMSGTPDHLQTQHHHHKAKSNSVPGY